MQVFLADSRKAGMCWVVPTWETDMLVGKRVCLLVPRCVVSEGGFWSKVCWDPGVLGWVLGVGWVTAILGPNCAP